MTSTEALIPMVNSVTQEVLETMFFSEAEAVVCGHGCDWIAARVRFSGEDRGELTVMLSRELALAASAGFLAEETAKVTAEQLNQVSCELANIICGAILSRLHPHARVTLGVPELAPNDFGDGVHQCFATPEGMLAVTIRMG
jgi:hypothetical protein